MMLVITYEFMLNDYEGQAQICPKTVMYFESRPLASRPHLRKVSIKYQTLRTSFYGGFETVANI